MMSGMNDKQSCSARARALVKPSAYLKRMNEFLTRFQRPYRRSVVTASSAESSSPEMVVVSGTRIAVLISQAPPLGGCRHRLWHAANQSAGLDPRVKAPPVVDDLTVHLAEHHPVRLRSDRAAPA